MTEQDKSGVGGQVRVDRGSEYPLPRDIDMDMCFSF
jgi:hypothetical protein